LLATRDVYFGLIPGNLLLLVAILVFGYLFNHAAARLFEYMMLGAPEKRFDRPGERWRDFSRHVLGQGRLLTESYAGVMHALIFWGFLVITVNTAIMIVRGLLPFIPTLWLDRFPPFLVLLEAFELLVLVGVLMALRRRIEGRPLRLNFSVDALFILGMIGGVLLFYVIYVRNVLPCDL
jgi:hypothetical protein